MPPAPYTRAGYRSPASTDSVARARPRRLPRRWRHQPLDPRPAGPELDHILETPASVKLLAQQSSTEHRSRITVARRRREAPNGIAACDRAIVRQTPRGRGVRAVMCGQPRASLVVAPAVARCPDSRPLAQQRHARRQARQQDSSRTREGWGRCRAAGRSRGSDRRGSKEGPASHRTRGDPGANRLLAGIRCPRPASDPAHPEPTLGAFGVSLPCPRHWLASRCHEGHNPDRPQQRLTRRPLRFMCAEDLRLHRPTFL